MKAIYLNDFDCEEDVFGAYNVPLDDRADVEILLADYTYKDWAGDSYVLFRSKSTGKLFEVYGAHCSCYGLEGQWDPEEVESDDLRVRCGFTRLKEYESSIMEIFDAVENNSTPEENTELTEFLRPFFSDLPHPDARIRAVTDAITQREKTTQRVNLDDSIEKVTWQEVLELVETAHPVWLDGVMATEFWKGYKAALSDVIVAIKDKIPVVH